MSRNRIIASTAHIVHIQRQQTTAERIAQQQLIESDPLLSLGKSLGAEITRVEPVTRAIVDQPTEPIDPPVVSAVEPLRSELDVKFEVDLARVCDTRGETRQWRIWTYGHRFNDGSGKIEKLDLFEALQRIGAVSSQRNFDSILAAGMNVYWTTGYHRNPEGHERLYIHLTGQKRLNKRITALELEKAPVTVGTTAPCQKPITMRSIDTNRPGMVYVWANLSGSISDVRDTVYNTWISVKAQKNGYVDISRRVLQALWKTPRKTLIQRERRTKLQHQAVYCESADPNDPLIPSYAYPAIDINGKDIATWRESNRYYPNPVDIHNHGGQRRKIRRAVNALIEASEPAIVHGGGLRIGRINFEHERVSAKCVNVREDGSKHYTQVIKSPEKLLKEHITREAKRDVKPHRHMLPVGKRHNVIIKELSSGNRYRSIGMQRDLHTESTASFRLYRSEQRRGLVAQWG